MKMKRIYSSALIAVLIAAAVGHTGEVVEEKLKIPPNDYSVVLEAVDADNPPSAEEMELAVEIINDRLAEKGYPGAVAEALSGTEMLVSMPASDDNAETVEFLCRRGRLQFLDADGNEIMDGSSRYISSASRQYGSPTGVGRQYYVELKFTDEGRRTFAAGTAAAIAQIAYGKNYIKIALDDDDPVSPSIHEIIDDDSCVIANVYTAEEAAEVAALINSGELPFEIRPQEIK